MEVLTTGLPKRGPFCLMLGNFDGVHVGHQAIIARAKAIADEEELRTAVLSFQPHPLKILAPEKAPKLLQTPSQKQRLLAHFGVDAYYPVCFDETMSKLSPDAFIEFLSGAIDFKHLLVGFNFRFGHQRRGDLEKLQALGKQFNFGLHAEDAVKDDQDTVSSSRIRDLVAHGNLTGAADLLGRPYLLEGEVTRGRQLGRTLAAPTANIRIANEMLPRFGVYATWVRLSGGGWFRGITNIGKAPTVSPDELRVETHIFEFSGDLYGQVLQLYFGAYLRAERKFDDLNALKQQIHRDFSQRLSLPDVDPPIFELRF